MMLQTAITTIPLALAALTSVSVALSAWQRRRQRSMDIARTGCGAIIGSMNDGVIVLDTHNRIATVNSAAQSIFGLNTGEVIGRSIARVLTDYPNLLAYCYDKAEGHVEITVDNDATRQHFDARISSLRDQTQNLTGRLIVFRDITKQAHSNEALRRAENESRQRLLEQTFIQEAIGHISSTLDLEAVLHHTAEQMCRTVNGAGAYTLTWEQATRTATVAAAFLNSNAGAQEQPSDLGTSYVVQDPRFLKALAAGQPWTGETETPNLPELGRWGAQTVLHVPLNVRGQTIGFITTWESRFKQKFTSREISLCQAIAQNAAITIENARLYEQMQQDLADRVRMEEDLRQLNEALETRVAERTVELTQMNAELVQGIEDRRQAEDQLIQRNRELLSLQSAAAATFSSLDLPFVLETVTWEMVNLLDVEGCTISEWNQETNTISVIAEYGVTSWWEEVSSVKAYTLTDYSLKTRVLAEKYAHQATISQADTETREYADMHAEQVKSLLMLPMVFQARVVGLVEIKDSRVERTFSDHEISLAQLLANQAAAAIENARLYAETQKRLREQTALREAGAAISSALDQETVLTRIAQQMGQAIDTTSAYICGLENGSELPAVLAGHIAPEACPQEQIPDLGSSQSAASMEASAAQFLEKMRSGQHDMSDKTDPNLPSTKRAHMQRSGAKTILYVPLLLRGQLIGFAELWESRRQREFSPEEISLCQGIAQQAAIAIENARLYEHAQREINERKRAEAQIKASLEEKEVLLQEIHHRVKNNLQVVSSLLNLQSRGIKDETALEMFQESQNRILSMALIHEKLYRSQDLSKIDLAGYIRSLATDLMHSYRSQSGPVQLKMNVTDVFLSIEQAVPCGLIINELISNALKHAFPGNPTAAGYRLNGKENEISIELSSDPQNRVTLQVSDNGVGFQEDLDIQALDSLGLRLINTLVSQLEGAIEMNNRDGTEIKLSFAAT